MDARHPWLAIRRKYKLHFFYLDESGCTGKDLKAKQQPIFILGGIIVRDEGWNNTHVEFEKILENYFEGNIPEHFELHTQDLFSSKGSGFFENHPREKRNALIHDILNLIATRKHHFSYIAVDKIKLDKSDVTKIENKEYIDLKYPYQIAYDYLITNYEKYTKQKLGKSARAMVILDEKDSIIEKIEEITRYRRFECAKKDRVKWLVEFSYAIDSEKNTMIQISDMFLFLTRKYLEIENGYKEDLDANVKEIFRGFYSKIHDRLIYKTLQQEDGKKMKEYNNFLQTIRSLPTTRWKSRKY